MGHYSSFFKLFNNQDKTNPPSGDINLFVGSSTFRHWESLADDMYPKPILNRGFGGSTMRQLLEFSERVILKYKFKKLFIYEADNDMGKTPEKFLELLNQLSEIIKLSHNHQPEAQIYILSPKCSPAKRKRCKWMMERNKKIEEVCEEYPYVTYVDIASGFVDENNMVKEEFFKDGMHPSELGYQYITKILKPLLYPEDIDY